MNFCIDLTRFISQIDLGSFLTFVALLLAYIAYVWSVNRDLESWKSLFVSFKKDLECQSPWLSSEYFDDNYKDKNSFNPYKIVFPLSFESLPEIIKKGVAEISWIPKSFLENITLFNERVLAFNQLLEYMRLSCISNPIITEKLKDKLNDIGLNDPEIAFDFFKNKIYTGKLKDKALYLAEQTRRLNKILHVDLIGNRNKKDKLNYLYTEILKELEQILDIFDRKKPLFIKYKNLIAVLSVLIYIFLVVFL